MGQKTAKRKIMGKGAYSFMPIVNLALMEEIIRK